VVPVIPHENEILADDTQPCHENDDENSNEENSSNDKKCNKKLSKKTNTSGSN